MKRKALLLTLALLILPSLSFAAMTCELVEVGGNYIYQGQMLLKFTADTTPETMVANLGDVTTVPIGQKIMTLLDGRRILEAYAYDGTGTDFDVASDLAVSDSDGAPFLTAAGNGANIWNGDNRFYFEDPNASDGYPPISAGKALTFTITGNTVNNSIGYLRLTLTGERNVR